MSLTPKSRLGWLSLVLIVAFGCTLGAFFLILSSGQRGGSAFFDNLLLAIPVLVAGAFGIAAFLVGVTSIIRATERSVLVFAASTMGLFVLLFTLGEVLSPH